jgi:hypothetical protein
MEFSTTTHLHMGVFLDPPKVREDRFIGLRETYQPLMTTFAAKKEVVGGVE